MPETDADPIIHDAEYYVLLDQHGEQWTAEDGELDTKLAELEARVMELEQQEQVDKFMLTNLYIGYLNGTRPDCWDHERRIRRLERFHRRPSHGPR